VAQLVVGVPRSLNALSLVPSIASLRRRWPLQTCPRGLSAWSKYFAAARIRGLVGLHDGRVPGRRRRFPVSGGWDSSGRPGPRSEGGW
jgi:hypothetical protein